MDGVDETQRLERLADLLTQLSSNPYDVALHAQHISLAMSLSGMDSQVLEAREMATNYVAMGDEVWIPIIDDKVASLAMEDGVKITEILELYERAERDYLSIPLLRKHVEFLINVHEHFNGTTFDSPEELQEVFTSEWARDAIDEVVAKGAVHLTQSQQLWQLQRDWELDMLDNTPVEDRAPLVGSVQNLILERLHQPHSGHEDTFQSYSSFTTKYMPANGYEGLLVAASKVRSRAAKAYERREGTELGLTSLDAYAQYIASERRAKNPDVFVLTGVYERAVAEAAKRRFAGEVGAEEALRSFWIGYLDFSRTQGVKDSEMTTLLGRATRSVPGSGEAWARYIRHLEKGFLSENESMEETESISDAYSRALSTNLFTKLGKNSPDRDPEQIIPLVLARASAEKHAIEAGRASEESLADLVKIVVDGLAMVRGASKTGDPRFRLEKFLSEWYLNLADMPDAAVQLWAATAKHYKSSWASWVAYTDVLIRTDHHDLARSTFQDVSTKNLDYPEALWDAWINFEYAHGSLTSLEESLARIERARTQVEARRMREAQKAFETAQAQYVMQQETVPAPTSAAVPKTGKVTGAHGIDEEGMDVDEMNSGALGKRKADDDEPAETADGKRQKLEKLPVPLKRDRENCTVFVADLPSGTNEEQLRTLFKDCGEIREVKITQLPQVLVATVEFTTRDSVPAALTKDKKRIDGTEVNVHLAWRSTLYATNFPEKWDDTSVRVLFGQYGPLFDVRWPSKKFKTTRRFCYVQYTSPESAERALELHGREVEPERTLNVYVSNPERKKGRTDADANEKEVYVAGLSKFTTKDDLQGLFSRYGPVKDIRLAEDKNGQLKGFAFIEFQNDADARSALSANNYELKKRRIAVTLADMRVRAKNRESSDTGLGRRAEARNRSVRIRNLPPDAQEGLLQQVLEKLAAVKRVEILLEEREAIVELENAAEAGKLTLRTEPIVFKGVNLDISEELPSGTAPAGPPVKTGGAMFVPRTAVSRPRAGLGRARKPGIGSAAVAANRGRGQSTASSGGQAGKSQNDFRKMLG
ncbi:hypothetical protein F5J12DRAFT_296247 [Pisolithus orientalis]|uniref:uncharacterized protein n=1 Tax=Pisolithus orientalis TaxID=936130 RepID=UPI002224FBCF|nr:uncharacterized protein F5J12DRAFT_296247 [Pisolithus orientalis]KAI6030527.1 hypothetical protein F5J12DRAFT_296247 [Pisolithus orientalis]